MKLKSRLLLIGLILVSNNIFSATATVKSVSKHYTCKYTKAEFTEKYLILTYANNCDFPNPDEYERIKKELQELKARVRFVTPRLRQRGN